MFLKTTRCTILYFGILLDIFGFVAPFLVDSQTRLGNGFYKAAVYEHPVAIPAKKAETYDEAFEQMLLNLNEYKTQTNFAGCQGVDIIVFPEDGIYSFRFNTPSEIENYLEYIPDPVETRWTPCSEPDRFNRTKVQAFLSCLARNNSLYLVANYGDMQPCLPGDPNCPKSGHYQYNTNIVFNRKGELIARYHKQNLFFETQFQEPINPEKIFFDTEFGRFGTFTCFDILFHDPAIPLIEKFNITNIVFPTAWMDALPFFSAIGYHSSFAVAYNVNFLASNLHLPSLRFQGSGIYTPSGPLAYFYDRSAKDGRLLIRNVPIISRLEKKLQKIVFTFGSTEMQYFQKPEFKATVFHDWYNFVRLDSNYANITVCQEGFCCFLSYRSSLIVGNYAFGVFNGIHPRNGPYYLQICILLKCASDDNGSCGRLTFTADRNFDYFNIRGNFSTPYVTPQTITSNNGSLELPSLHSMRYDETGLTGKAITTPLLETSLIGRVYESD